MVVLGKNIQKEEMTKNNKEAAKNTFKKNNGLFEFALCNFVNFSMK